MTRTLAPFPPAELPPAELPRRAVRWTSPRRPGFRRILAVLVVAGLVLGASTMASSLGSLWIPPPTGIHAVGKADTVLTDPARGEPATTALDARRLRVVAWYPALAGTGTPAAYLDDLDTIRDGLVRSGQVGELEAAGLGWVTDPARADATPVVEGNFPVVVLSPGNATNVEFYASLAEELASHGYAVFGVDHAYQVAAVDLGGDVAVYAGDPPLSEAQRVIPERIDQRVADIDFVLDRLAADAAGFAALDGFLDLERIAVVGHSNGGITAAESCGDARVDACVNIDGQLAGGPFGARQDAAAPAKPFLFLTKETELHPVLADRFEAAGLGAVRVVVPAASHADFADGARFRPRLLPAPTTADEVTTVTRGFSLAFLDHVLGGAPRSVLGDVEAPTDVRVHVYPLIPKVD